MTNITNDFIAEQKTQNYNRFFSGVITGIIIVLAILIYAEIAEKIV